MVLCKLFVHLASIFLTTHCLVDTCSQNIVHYSLRLSCNLIIIVALCYSHYLFFETCASVCIYMKTNLLNSDVFSLLFTFVIKWRFYKAWSECIVHRPSAYVRSWLVEDTLTTLWALGCFGTNEVSSIKLQELAVG